MIPVEDGQIRACLRESPTASSVRSHGFVWPLHLAHSRKLQFRGVPAAPGWSCPHPCHFRRTAESDFTDEDATASASSREVGLMTTSNGLALWPRDSLDLGDFRAK